MVDNLSRSDAELVRSVLQKLMKPDDPGPLELREIAAAVRLRALADAALAETIRVARGQPMRSRPGSGTFIQARDEVQGPRTWEEIGEVLGGVTRQAACKRWNSICSAPASADEG